MDRVCAKAGKGVLVELLLEPQNSGIWNFKYSLFFSFYTLLPCELKSQTMVA